MRLHVERTGDGPKRAALVHGFLGASTEWHDLIAAAGDGCTFLAVDLRGHGRSPRADTSSLAGGRVLAGAVARLALPSGGVGGTLLRHAPGLL